jgi:hypothetical protein
MGTFLSPSLFGAIFSVSYATLAIVDWTPFLYYPLINQFSRVPLPTKSGPSMHWYGWIVTAVVIAFVICALVPRRWTRAIERPLAWIPTAAAILAILIFEKKWFV